MPSYMTDRPNQDLLFGENVKKWSEHEPKRTKSLPGDGDAICEPKTKWK